jgi:hypothetical protein
MSSPPPHLALVSRAVPPLMPASSPWRRSLRGLAAVALALLVSAGAVACSDDAAKDAKDAGEADVASGDGGSHDTGADGAAALPAVDPAPDCDPLMPSWCALPFPSGRFLVDDASTATGKRLQFGPTTLPSNGQGFHIAAEPFARMDGYAVSTSILVHYPGVDISALAHEDDLAPSLAADAPIALWDLGPVKTPSAQPTRVPYWAELDQTAGEASKQALWIRPGVILHEAHRYVVAIAGLRDVDGNAFAASPAFAALRDGATTGSYLAGRQAEFDALFATIEAAGGKRADLILAWDFVTASDAALHGDLLTVRDKAFEIVGELGAEVTVTKITVADKAQDPHIALRIEGEMTVPDFTEAFDIGARMGDQRVGDQKGYRLRRDAAGKPLAKGTRKVPFWAMVPHTALDGSPHGLVQYGHGLLGRGSQVYGSFNRKIAYDHKLIYFACDWTGMAEADETPITQMIFDFSDFYMLPERLHQGMAEALLLMRAMRERFTGLPGVKGYGLQIDDKRVYYTGISQGGIYGGTYMALSQDVVRGHLGVPGQNYSLLLHRSVDFAPFFVVMIGAYAESIDRAIILNAGQILWDKVDPASHYRHISVAPYADTPKHEVLLASAKGDWQVALLSNEITTRSGVGVALMKGYGKPVWGVEPVDYPHKGSALVNYDFGNPWPKPGNLPDDTVGEGLTCGHAGMCLGKALCAGKAGGSACELNDPHGKPRRLDHHNTQLVHFLDTGEVIDVCGGDGCTPE